MTLDFDRGALATINEPTNDDFKIFDRGALYTYVATTGTTYTKTLTASVTSTGTQTRIASYKKTLTSSVSVTGTQTKVSVIQYQKTLTATVNVTGTQTRIASYKKTLTASVTATGTQTKIGSHKKTLTASVTVTGTQTKSVGDVFTKTLTASVTVTGTQTKVPRFVYQKELTATVTVTGTQTKVALITYTKELTASVTVTGTQTKVYNEVTDAINVTAMRQSELYGGQNDTRVFMFGKDNKLIYSELADGLPTAEYFPESNSILVSSDNYDITGLTKQYDRLIIHKENEAHYANYEISSTLGTIFSTFPLNDTIGNRAFGETRLILNNPFTVHDGVYQYSGTNVRDERNAILMSERVQLGLDTLDLTQAITFDFEKNFEYFIAVGNIVYVYNYKIDAWYKYELTDTPTAFIEIEGEAYFGTSTGQIMKFDADEFTDNSTIFTAEWETGFMNFGANWIRKFLTYGWITLKPESRSSVEINWETDQGTSPTPYILEYLNMDFGNVDFGDFSFSTNFSPRPFREKFKAKKFAQLKMKGKNETNTDKMTILSITLPAVTGGQVK